MRIWAPSMGVTRCGLQRPRKARASLARRTSCGRRSCPRRAVRALHRRCGRSRAQHRRELERPAGLRCLEEERDDEVGVVEMPAELVGGAVVHVIERAERVVGAEERVDLRARPDEQHQLGRFVERAHGESAGCRRTRCRSSAERMRTRRGSSAASDSPEGRRTRRHASAPCDTRCHAARARSRPPPRSPPTAGTPAGRTRRRRRAPPAPRP